MKQFEIYNAEFKWKNCNDVRPWIIVGEPIGDNWQSFPISGQQYGAMYAFVIEREHPDFAATGLKKTCFIHYGTIFEVPGSCFKAPRGELQNELLVKFRLDAGI